MASIPVRDEFLEKINRVIIEYINGGERMLARSRWFLSKEEGGYGMFDMKTLNLCIKAAWIKKWMSPVGRDYSDTRCLKGCKIPDFINMEEINTVGWYSSGEVMQKWLEYKQNFYSVGKNMLGAHLFFNNFLKVEGRIVNVRVFS
jgi:hypothetical protein